MDVHEALRQAEMRAKKYRDALEAVPVVLGQLDSDGKDFLTVIMQTCFEAGMEEEVEWRKQRNKKDNTNFLRTYRIEHTMEKECYWGDCKDSQSHEYLGWTMDKGKARVYSEEQRKRISLPTNGCWVVIQKQEDTIEAEEE